MILAMEKFMSLVVMLNKLHDHGKATSINTRSFPLSKTIKINERVFLHFLVGVFRVFAYKRVPLEMTLEVFAKSNKHKILPKYDA